jgi:prophage regulatory protein
MAQRTARHSRNVQYETRESFARRRRLIRLPEVLQTVGLSRSEWYRLISIGKAPRSVPLGARARGWDDIEVQGWIAERIAARDSVCP